MLGTHCLLADIVDDVKRYFFIKGKGINLI